MQPAEPYNFFGDPGFDCWLDEQLQQRGMPPAQLSDRIVQQLGGRERYADLVIDCLNRFSGDYIPKHRILLEQLATLTEDDLKRLLASDDPNPARYLLVYHYVLARDAYASMFVNFRRVVARPPYFVAALVDCLDLDFNVDLFVCAKPLASCRGALFRLQEGCSHADRMGLLLCPPAFACPLTLFQTVFHELSHRLDLARYGPREDKVEHEFYAYFHDKLLLQFFRSDVDLSWLAPAFEFDLVRLARTLREEQPRFLWDTMERFTPDLERMIAQLLQRSGDVLPGMGREKLERRCFLASRAKEVPPQYQSILAFLWFYSTRLSAAQKAGAVEPEKVQATLLVLLIVFSMEYEQKYQCGQGVSYGKVSFHLDGALSEGEERYLASYCAFQQAVCGGIHR